MNPHPPLLSPGYGSTLLRAPRQEPILLPHPLADLTGPALGEGPVAAADADLTAGPDGEAQGQRIVVHGQVRDADGRPVRDTLLEVWQANAAGRYRHRWDRHDAPLDPHFTGVGRALTDAQGRYRFVTVKPGAYPWGNHANAWRPAHIHFSVFGRAFTQRLVTQMYFPDDPLFAYDPIYNSVPEFARDRLVAGFDLSATVESWALGYRFDIVLAGTGATPMETP
ncbi:protocatechuate 3,4-dioxygenase subunit beta [Amorphoplanes digitatis]|uniref:Protocatechuate 3,4-dioxygenase beta subunit n=1 Tax=Actinoplanes digitatis TaxID=1868 RepID=A0A7W7HXV4_9ACTN|nr:protocatechuate 3,4-dioxygenase subunit beta [Actinoplanes digitatis]MBB4762767.1 protocatechuate 3,4-dioxygenase beta subunit [Actinoplanes digitatis]GID91737.1 protocatechuate 3,4-dioxygenase subunit beta [Actinoplanes digitatis]